MNTFRKTIQSKVAGNGDIVSKLFKEYKVAIHGTEINILETPDRDKKALLLMPGALGSSWTSFGPQLKELPTLLPEHKIVAWDPPGCGKSIPPEREFCMNLFRNDAHMAVELMTTLGCGSFSVLGWSDGGIVALIMGGRFPECIDKLVVWSSGAYITENEVNHLRASNGLNQLPLDYRLDLEKLYGKERLNEMWTNWTQLLCDFHAVNRGDICATEVDCIQAPTLILRGGEDNFTDPEHVEFLQNHIQSCKYLELPNGGFDMHLTHSKEFNELATKFLLEKPT